MAFWLITSVTWLPTPKGLQMPSLMLRHSYFKYVQQLCKCNGCFLPLLNVCIKYLTPFPCFHRKTSTKSSLPAFRYLSVFHIILYYYYSYIIMFYHCFLSEQNVILAGLTLQFNVTNIIFLVSGKIFSKIVQE